MLMIVELTTYYNVSVTALSTCCIIAVCARLPQNTRQRSDVTERPLSAQAPIRMLLAF